MVAAIFTPGVYKMATVWVARGFIVNAVLLCITIAGTICIRKQEKSVKSVQDITATEKCGTEPPQLKLANQNVTQMVAEPIKMVAVIFCTLCSRGLQNGDLQFGLPGVVL